ncbi:hypothetical protein [Rudaeicoccus suwonensis]|uniref:Replication restart DNA helicase PriA n=1 Tax=Rudaeicoccus suwonensis TaxID=657409 RepID=A0A561DWW8_9MICO|nr:hypothetical protein [Rudaeicoccus suwonensis]TWE07853.1 hypothetical protein BKA23_3220 [Rudaeicoccus suwonensis]
MTDDAPPPLPDHPVAAESADAAQPGPPPVPARHPVPDRLSEPGAMPEPAGMPQPPPLHDTAMLQSTEVTRTYPCPSCGGSLGFDPQARQLKCPACGRLEALAPVAGSITKRDLASTMQHLAQHRGEQHQHQLGREVVCQNCGGTTAFDGTLTATRCPYCATPIQRDDLQTAPERLPIDGVLPLMIGEKDARERINAWINGRWFAPKEFKKYREIGSFTSIYLSYFTYDATTTTQYTGMRGEDYTVEVGDGDNRHTETRTNWWPTSGTVVNDFRDLVELANTGLDERKVDALEPWPLQEAQPYSPQFVAGHLSRTYDADAGQRFDDGARSKIEREVDHTIRRDIGGDQQRITSREIGYNSLVFAQLLLPVWLLTVTFEGRPFQVFINGATGEVQGQRPWSKVKLAFAVLVAVIVIAVVALIYKKVHG